MDRFESRDLLDGDEKEKIACARHLGIDPKCVFKVSSRTTPGNNDFAGFEVKIFIPISGGIRGAKKFTDSYIAPFALGESVIPISRKVFHGKTPFMDITRRTVENLIFFPEKRVWWLKLKGIKELVPAKHFKKSIQKSSPRP